eukprot:928596-Prymnesium_polylepis.1
MPNGPIDTPVETETIRAALMPKANLKARLPPLGAYAGFDLSNGILLHNSSWVNAPPFFLALVDQVDMQP